MIEQLTELAESVNAFQFTLLQSYIELLSLAIILPVIFTIFKKWIA